MHTPGKSCAGSGCCALGHLPFMPDEVGSAWNRSAQIDVAGINAMEKTLILGECKWTLEAADRKVMANLVEEKIARIVPKQGHWRVYLLGFSPSGWTSGAQAYQEAIQRAPLHRENWVSSGMYLLDLSQVDADLAQWSA